MHGRLFNALRVVQLESLSLLGNDHEISNTINTCLINLNIVFYPVFPLNINEYLKYN